MRFPTILAGLFTVVYLAGCSQPSAVVQPTSNAAVQVIPTPSVASPIPAAPTTPPTVAPTNAPTAAPTAAPTSIPSPTPRGAPRIGVQVGHWKITELPDEQAKLRTASGSFYNGYDEWELNMMIAEPLRDQLEAAGYEVDLLPATIPPGYQADAFISVHTNGASGSEAITRRGWMLATPWRASEAAEALAEAVTESFPRITGQPDDARGASFDMRGYYAFSAFRYQHAIAPTTPAILIECGYMTHPVDRQLLFKQPALVAQGIAEGVITFLQNHNRDDAAVVAPIPFPKVQAGGPLALLRQPDPDSQTMIDVSAGEPLEILAGRPDWYLVTERKTWEIGWVRRSDVVKVP